MAVALGDTINLDLQQVAKKSKDLIYIALFLLCTNSMNLFIDVLAYLMK